MSTADPRRLVKAARFSLSTVLGEARLDGAWWPHSVSVARELSGLIDALGERLGQVVDIGVNWSAIDGVLDFDSMGRRGISVTPGLKQLHHRVMTITGDKAEANLLVVPCGTSAGLAVLVMRRAASLPILTRHLDTNEYRIADDIVRAAQAECVRPRKSLA